MQILPQRFEYELIDKDRFRIGDTLLDGNNIDLEITPTSSGNYHLRFRWPASLLKSGEVILKDNAGKAIWQQSLETENLKFERVLQKSADGTEVHADMAVFQTDKFETEHMKRLKIAPFFRFCVHNEEALTRMYLCSKDLYFKKIGKKSVIKSRDSLRDNSFVSINGRIVGNQGMIFLQSRSDVLSLQTVLVSGVSLELDTRLKDVDFKDLYLTEKKQILIKAAGAEPVHEEQLVSKNDKEWVGVLNRERPIVYLQGEGGIPMRQEFIINGPIRPGSLQVPVEPGDGETYGASTAVTLKGLNNVSFTTNEKDSSVEKIGDTNWHWQLNNLRVDKKNRRYVLVNTEQGNYVGATDVFRAKKNELFVDLGLPSLTGDLRFLQWLNRSFGWDVAYRNYIQQNSGNVNFSSLSAELNYRFTPGLYLITPSHGLLASYDYYNSNQFQLGGFGLGGFLMFDAPKTWQNTFDWYICRLKIPLIGSNGTYNLSGTYLAEFVLKKKQPTWTWEAGLRSESYRFTSSSAAEVDISRLSAIIGASYLF